MAAEFEELSIEWAERYPQTARILGVAAFTARQEGAPEHTLLFAERMTPSAGRSKETEDLGIDPKLLDLYPLRMVLFDRRGSTLYRVQKGNANPKLSELAGMTSKQLLARFPDLPSRHALELQERVRQFISFLNSRPDPEEFSEVSVDDFRAFVNKPRFTRETVITRINAEMGSSLDDDLPIQSLAPQTEYGREYNNWRRPYKPWFDYVAQQDRWTKKAISQPLIAISRRVFALREEGSFTLANTIRIPRAEEIVQFVDRAKGFTLQGAEFTKGIFAH